MYGTDIISSKFFCKEYIFTLKISTQINSLSCTYYDTFRKDVPDVEKITGDCYIIYMKKLFPLCLFLLILLSCAAQINGSLAADGSAVLSVSMSLEPRMTTLIRSLSAAGGQTEGPVLDGPAIARSMAEAPGIASVTFRNTAPAAIEGQVRISQISEFLAAAEEGFILFEQGRSRININLENGPVIIKLLSPEIADYLNALFAPLASGWEMTKEEYLNLVTSFYNRAVSDEIASSRIRISIEFPGTITGVIAPGQSGNFLGRRANFDIPLLDLLVLEKPLVYEVTWN